MRSYPWCLLGNSKGKIKPIIQYRLQGSTMRHASQSRDRDVASPVNRDAALTDHT